MIYELQKQGLVAQSHTRITVFYEKEVVGEYLADIVVENSIILGLKAVESILPLDEIRKSVFYNFNVDCIMGVAKAF